MKYNLSKNYILYFQEGGKAKTELTSTEKNILRTIGYALPGVSTYLSYLDFKENPTLGNGTMLGLSLLPLVGGAKLTSKILRKPKVQISPNTYATPSAGVEHTKRFPKLESPKIKRNAKTLQPSKNSMEDLLIKPSAQAVEPGMTYSSSSGITPLSGSEALQAFVSRIKKTKGLTDEEKAILLHNVLHPIRTNNYDDVVELIKLKEFPGDVRSLTADVWARDRMKTLYGGKIENVVQKHPGWFTDLALGFSGLYDTEGMPYDEIVKRGGLSRMRVIMADPQQKRMAPEQLAYYKAHYSPANDFYLWKDTLTHEVAHLRDILYKAKGMIFPNPSDYGINAKAMGDYYNMYNNTEILARGTLIKNALGIADKTTKITGDLLKWLAANWKSLGLKDNGMSKLFAHITDWDKAAEYFSRYSLGVIPVAVGAPLVYNTLNTSENERIY